jgi:hypothetical protein
VWGEPGIWGEGCEPPPCPPLHTHFNIHARLKPHRHMRSRTPTPTGFAHLRQAGCGHGAAGAVEGQHSRVPGDAAVAQHGTGGALLNGGQQREVGGKGAGREGARQAKLGKAKRGPEWRGRRKGQQPSTRQSNPTEAAESGLAAPPAPGRSGEQLPGSCRRRA